MTRQWWVIDGWSAVDGSVQIDGHVSSTHDTLDDALIDSPEVWHTSHILEIERDPETGSVYIVDAIMERP